MAPPRDFVYPAWFNRVYAISTEDPQPEDFDEDISEIGDGETPDVDDDGEEDDKFDSYNLFVSLRQERKFDLQREKELKAQREAERDAIVANQQEKVAGIKAAYEAMVQAEQDGEDLAIDPLSFYQRIWNLYCPEYKYLTYERLLLEGTPGFFEFNIVDEDEMEINGNLVIDQYNLSGHDGQEAQTTAGTTEHTLSLRPNEGAKNWSTEVNLTEDTREWTFGVVFIDEDHVLVRVSRELAFRALPEGPPDGAPELLEFWGISRRTDS